MILGRNSLQWLGLVALLLQVAKQFVAASPTLTFACDFATAVVAVTMTWIAQTSTTPTADPQLIDGTMVRVTDATGRVIGHAPIEAPTPAAAKARRAAPKPPRDREVE